MSKPEIKFPKSLALCADKFYKIREERRELDKKVAELKSLETAYQNHLINELPASDATGISGKICRVSVTSEDQPTIEDREAFRRYINRTKRFDLAYALRPSAPACRAMWEDGREVPGVGKFINKKLSVSKL